LLLVLSHPLCLGSIAGEKDFIENFQGVLGLLYLPLSHTAMPSHGGKEHFDILLRSVPQPFSGEKSNKVLRPSDIIGRVVGR